MTNRDIRDNEPRDKRDYDMKNKNDMSWLLPALIGLMVIGAVAYYLMRRPMITEKPALPATVEHVATTPMPVTTTTTHEAAK